MKIVRAYAPNKSRRRTLASGNRKIYNILYKCSPGVDNLWYSSVHTYAKRARYTFREISPAAFTEGIVRNRVHFPLVIVLPERIQRFPGSEQPGEKGLAGKGKPECKLS